MKTNSSFRGSTAQTTKDPLAVLEVFDRLEVGPVRVEKRRLIASYRLFQGGREDDTELIYSYPEEVFDADEPESFNLASMIAAQVAINYGLFCRSIHFHGCFEPADQKFLQDALENTSREIYVNKFLHPNPFLIEGAVGLPAVKRKSYLRARLSFEGTGSDIPLSPWLNSLERSAVLSSGGKDSLLSFSLMRELGKEVHPIFGNESGRHWLTSLNAYRHFEAEVPHTARVWTNSDRVFSWMLRHFPFVRKDFSQLRSDGYPIRLWTVGVFLFGALPLLRKRRIGRLLIGDEIDTTHRTSRQGISHYDGLYDQSRYFDNSLTRYFRRKGWNIEQFSLLRPLSELLILKILSERYGELQRHQISCHAAHQEGETVKPCGRCEKCRRIVCMLKAIDADPSHCGYTREQTERCLKEFDVQGINQEAAGAQHLEWLLAEKDLIPLGKKTSTTRRARPEVMALRFDPERSPLNWIPVDLRKPLYQIYLQYVTGAVLKKGRTWIPHDPYSTDSLTRAYPFGRKRIHSPPETPAEASEREYLLGGLTWPEAKKRFAEMDIALFPVGAIEQHGPHLPLDTDAFDADYLVRRVAARCTDPKPIVLPLMPYGVSYHHDDFSGTISVTNETLAQLVYEVGMSVASHGITKLVIVNGHGGNEPTLNFAAQMINRDAHIFTCVDSGETSDTDVYQLIETPNDVHAGEIETSTSMAIRPELVKQYRAKKLLPRFSNHYLDFTSTYGIPWYAYTRKISPDGVLGDPSRASTEKGGKIWEVMIDHLVAFVEGLKGLTLDEIYQRRY